MPERLEIDGLRTLLAIAAQGGVTRAAEHLGMSQSAVSHKMRRLEQALDCDLLARRAGGPLLTDAGTRLCDYAQRMIDLHDEALADLGKKPLTGTIRLGMTEDTTISGVSRILGRFTRLYPGVDVRMRTSQSVNIQDWLAKGDVDVGVMQVFRRDAGKDDAVLFHDSLHWVKAPDFSFDPSRPVPFLSFDQNCFYRQWGFTEGLARGHRFEKVLECPSAAGIQSAVRSGLGVALLNGMHLAPDIEVIDGIFPDPPEVTFVARIRPRSRSAAARTLVSEIAREFRAPPPLRATG